MMWLVHAQTNSMFKRCDELRSTAVCPAFAMVRNALLSRLASRDVRILIDPQVLLALSNLRMPENSVVRSGTRIRTPSCR
jgi:hypothetical protein